jgi:membrane protein YqaA with SNARE-associated domain
MRNTSGGMTDLLAYFGLFMAAFGAATILPMQSEAVLAGLLLTGRYSAVWLVVTAGVGNILGSLVNWMLGRGIERFRQRRWFPVGEDTLDRAQAWYRKYGKWSLLASWVPIVGDPITVVAGVLREPLPTFLLLVTIAKLGRYVIVALATMNLA